MPLFKRKKEKKAPEGWVTAEALVDIAERTRVSNKTSPMTAGANDFQIAKYDKYEFGYTFKDQDGKLVKIDDSARLSLDERPIPGKLVTLAYNPSNPEEWALLEGEGDRTWRLVKEFQRLIEDESAAPVEVTKVERTGRVSRPTMGDQGEKLDPAREAPEVMLTMRVSPPDGSEFDVSRPYFDRQIGIEVGTKGVLFYDPDRPEEGTPHFAKPEELAGGGDPVEVARQSFIGQYAHIEIPKAHR